MNRTEANIITARVSKNTRPTFPGPDQVVQLAYGLYEAQGRQDGHDVEDWLLAEDRLANRVVDLSVDARSFIDLGGKTT